MSLHRRAKSATPDPSATMATKELVRRARFLVLANRRAEFVPEASTRRKVVWRANHALEERDASIRQAVQCSTLQLPARQIKSANQARCGARSARQASLGTDSNV